MQEADWRLGRVDEQFLQRTLEQQPFPDNQTQAVRALLSSYNTSLKALTFLLIPDDRQILREQLSRVFKAITIETPFANHEGLNAVNYAMRSHVRNGLVQAGYIPITKGQKRYMDFQKTAAGRTLGTQAAALQLAYEMLEQRATAPILGKTGAPGDDTPHIRARIMLHIGSTGRLVQSDIYRAIDTQEEIALRNVKALAAEGMLERTVLSRKRVYVDLTKAGHQFITRFLAPIQAIAQRDAATLTDAATVTSQVVAELPRFVANSARLYIA